MRTAVTLYFGPAGLSRIYCGTCKEETLHLRGQCVHEVPLHTNSNAARTRAPSVARSWRADHDAMAKVRMPGKRNLR